jgi:nicotinamidase-related amidase
MQATLQSIGSKPWFTPATAAVVLIDHQVGTATMIKSLDAQVALQNAALLAKTALILGMPLVLTSSMEDNFQGLISPLIQEAAPEAYAKRIKRRGIVDAWTDPNFKAAVVATNRTKLIMAGVTTDICLIFPSIDAVNDGFEVKAVMDASGSPFELSESTARIQMQEAGVVLTATITIIAELIQDWSGPNGPELQKLMMATLPH